MVVRGGQQGGGGGGYEGLHDKLLLRNAIGIYAHECRALL